MLQTSTQPSRIPTATPVPLNEWSDGALTLSGLMFCQDTQALCVLERALDRLNIETSLALDSDDAHEQFGNVKFDVAIVDFKDAQIAGEIVTALRASKMNHNCTVIAIADDGSAHLEAFKAGANFTIPRVHTGDAAMRCMRSSHFLILSNKRASMRFPLDVAGSICRNGGSKLIPATVKNLSETGLRLKCSAEPRAGEMLDVSFQLPNGHVSAELRAVWLSGDGEAGCLFTNIDSANLKTVREWISAKLLGRLQ